MWRRAERIPILEATANERQYAVTVWGENFTVTVSQRSKAVWIACGDYMGHALEVKRNTEGGALKGWRDTARHKGR